jgi:hypothetical protein
MTTLKFDTDIDINDVFKDYKKEIFKSVISSIKENCKNREINEINVVNISIKSKNYSINLTRDKFVNALNRCIDFFAELEMYEQCKDCVDIISILQEK